MEIAAGLLRGRIAPVRNAETGLPLPERQTSPKRQTPPPGKCFADSIFRWLAAASSI
jgi:hypothetical protein